MADAFREKLRQTALKHIEAYNSPDPWDAEAIWAVKEPHTTHYLHPSQSLKPEFRGRIEQKKHKQFMHFFAPVFDKFLLTVTWIAIDTTERTVVTGLDCTMDLKAFGDEPAVTGYTADYVWAVKMNESGDKIIEIHETLDVQRLTEFVAERAHSYAAWLMAQQE